MTDLIQITPDMDDEDRNVAHSINARQLLREGDLEGAAAEVALDRGFLGTFGEWLAHARKAEAEAEAQEKAHRSAMELWG